MTRTFLHEFRPPQDSPVAGPDVQLTVQEIEDAGLREVLQAPGARHSAGDRDTLGSEHGGWTARALALGT